MAEERLAASRRTRWYSIWGRGERERARTVREQEEAGGGAGGGRAAARARSRGAVPATHLVAPLQHVIGAAAHALEDGEELPDAVLADWGGGACGRGGAARARPRCRRGGSAETQEQFARARAHRSGCGRARNPKTMASRPRGNPWQFAVWIVKEENADGEARPPRHRQRSKRHDARHVAGRRRRSTLCLESARQPPAVPAAGASNCINEHAAILNSVFPPASSGRPIEFVAANA
jgi:hypothetical protein